jgi:hypothetical protein
VAPTAPLPDLDHLKLLDAAVEGRLAAQHDEWDGIERKGTTILGATGVLLGLVVNNGGNLGAYPGPAPLLFGLAVLALSAGVLAGVVTIWPRDFAIVPEPADLLDVYAAKATDFTIGTLLRTKQKAFEKNRRGLQPKVLAIRAQLILLAVGAVALLLVLTIREVTQMPDQNNPAPAQPTPAQPVSPAPSSPPAATPAPAPTQPSPALPSPDPSLMSTGTKAARPDVTAVPHVEKRT